MGVSSENGVEICFFFFQAEDGIRDSSVTGVQTCALPISTGMGHPTAPGRADHRDDECRREQRKRPEGTARHQKNGTGKWRGEKEPACLQYEIGRASCRERV